MAGAPGGLGTWALLQTQPVPAGSGSGAGDQGLLAIVTTEATISLTREGLPSPAWH